MIKQRKSSHTTEKILLFLMIIGIFLWGYLTTHNINPNSYDHISIVDTLIPLVSVFVIFYLLFFILFVMSFIYFWNDYKAYVSLCISMMLILIIAFLTYTIYQTLIIRPVIPDGNFFDNIVNYLYYIDTNRNNFPSLHVSISTLITLFIYKKDKALGTLLIPFTILIILSTMFIKQHMFIDVLGGLLLALIVFYFVGYGKK